MRNLVLAGLLLVVAASFLAKEVEGRPQEEEESWDSEEEDSVEVPPIPVGSAGQVPASPASQARVEIPAAKAQAPIAQQLPGSSHGSNYAGYDQRCAMDSESGVRCNPRIGLTCDMRICKCLNSTLEADLFNVYSPAAGKCVKVARAVDGWTCEYDVQCKHSRQGNFSECNYRTNRCECTDVDGLGREVIRVDGICYVKKEIGSQCSNDLECQNTIDRNAVCMGTKQKSLGICDCAGGFAYDPLHKECLAEAEHEDSPCKSDSQCNHETALGELSRCNPATNKCQCWDTKSNRNSKVGFYKLTHKCYYEKKENDVCDLREECSLGFHRKADCLPHPAYNDEKVCQCPLNETCGSSGLASLSLLFLIAAAFLVKSF